MGRPDFPVQTETADLGRGVAVWVDAGVVRPVVVELPTERVGVEALGDGEVGHRELDVVDGVVSVRRWLRDAPSCTPGTTKPHAQRKVARWVWAVVG